MKSAMHTKFATLEYLDALHRPVNRNLELILVIAATLITGMGLALVTASRSGALTSAGETVAQGELVNLNTAPRERIATVLAAVMSIDESDWAAGMILKQRAIRPLENVGAARLIRVTASDLVGHLNFSGYQEKMEVARQAAFRRRSGMAAGLRTFLRSSAAPSVYIALLQADELRAVKPNLIVREPLSVRKHWLSAILRWFGGFFLVHLVWRVRKFSGDILMLPAIQMLTGCGLLLMISLRDSLREQELFSGFSWGILAGCVAMLFVSLIDFDRFSKGISYAFLWTALLLGAALIAFGSGPGGVQVNLLFFQPVEFIRILIALFLAGYFASHWDALRRFTPRAGRFSFALRAFGVARLEFLLPVVLGVGATLAIFFTVHDMGPALVLGWLCLSVYGIARGQWRLPLLGALLIACAITLGYRAGVPQLVSYRIDLFLHPWDNRIPRGGEHIAHAIWSLATGGITGTGPGLGQGELMPEAHTDMITAAAGEEYGFLGLLSFVVLYALLVVRSMQAAYRAQSTYGFLLVSTLVLAVCWQTALITAGMLDAFPLSGVVTPFLTHGMSSMIANFVVFGIILAISSRPGQNKNRERFGPAVRKVKIALAVIATALMMRAAWFQIVKADEFLVKPAIVRNEDSLGVKYNPRIASALDKLPRGDIVDRNGIPLATSNYSTAMKYGQSYEAMGVKTSEIGNKGAGRYYPLGPESFYLLGDVQSNLKRGSRISFVEQESRIRLQGFDDERRLVVVDDGKGKTVRLRLSNYRALIPLLRHRFEPGRQDVKNLIDANREVKLSIDARLQHFTANKLAEIAAEHPGAAVVMNAETGAVLALVSYPWPSYAQLSGDSHEQTNDLLKRLSDRARAGEYPPGSVFKLVTAMAALSKNPELANKEYDCSRLSDGRVGTIIHGYRRPIRDDINDRQPHGRIRMGEAIIKSCNAYFAQLGTYDVKLDALIYTASLFGIEVGTGHSNPQEYLPQASYGQTEVLATPFQMARVAAAVANGGHIMQGRWVVDSGIAGASQLESILSPSLMETLGGWMRTVVTSGTASSLAGVIPAVAGKTGTAQVDNADPHSWFVGFAPWGSPGKRIAFAILVENGGYGGAVSASLAGEIVNRARALDIIHE